jgi:NADH-quinone oxidoreductase subunit J
VEVQQLLFYALGALALLSAVAMVCLGRQLVAAALCLLLTTVSVAGIDVLLRAEFVGIVHLLVYPGAIGIVLLFAIVLLDPRPDDMVPLQRVEGLVKVLGAGGVLGIAALFSLRLRGSLASLQELAGPVPDGFGGHRALGLALYGDYLVPLEVVGLILLTAIVAAVVLAKRSLD